MSTHATKRPVFLDLTRIRQPIPAIVSILHRASGVLMVLAIPLFAALFGLALSGPDGFARAAALVGHPLGRLVLLLLSWALLHHLLAGVRYLVIDLGIGVDRPAARASAWTVLSLALLFTIVIAGMLL